MTLEEKREALGEFCVKQSCNPKKCPLFITHCDWEDADSAEVDKLYRIAFPTSMSNPYWYNITKIAHKQRAKGMETYGQGLEDNDKPTVDRITYIEEELVDALMYLEWLKESIKDGR